MFPQVPPSIVGLITDVALIVRAAAGVLEHGLTGLVDLANPQEAALLEHLLHLLQPERHHAGWELQAAGAATAWPGLPGRLLGGAPAAAPTAEGWHQKDRCQDGRD